MSRKILMVEDGEALPNPLKSRLEYEGFEVIAARGGEKAIEAVSAERPDLVILDVTLPLREELEACRRLRHEAHVSTLPILLLSGKGEPVEKLLVPGEGADDFMTRPADPPELVVRVKALLQRAAANLPPRVLKSGAIEVDRERYLVTVDARPVRLTGKEFKLLRVLMEAEGRVVRRRSLLEQVWGYASSSGVESRTLDVHIRTLRKKLGTEGSRIVTVRTIGYRLSLVSEWIRFGSETPQKAS